MVEDAAERLRLKEEAAQKAVEEETERLRLEREASSEEEAEQLRLEEEAEQLDWQQRLEDNEDVAVEVQRQAAQEGQRRMLAAEDYVGNADNVGGGTRR